MTETPISEEVSTKLQRIATLSSEDPKRTLLTLAHYIDVDFLKEAYRRTRKDGAVGVDGQTAKAYAANLEENLTDLVNRFKAGTYYAPPVKRTWIPKSDGTERPLGIPTFEDKVLQRAVAMVVSEVYEANFYSTSYGFRPNKSAKQALDELREQLFRTKGGWVIDADIKAYFDNIPHGQLREIIRQRVGDGVIRRQIDKWLKAGVVDKGELQRAKEGTPQGGVISPLLANIYLHVVLDEWFEVEVKPRMQGRCFHIRFADDFVLGFEYESDARKVFEVLSKRFERFGLTIHPEKTKLVQMNRPVLRSRGKGENRRGERPGTFDFLGFTHFWTKSRRGYWVVAQQTAKGRFQRSLTAITEWCRRNRHEKLADQHKMLSSKLRGHYNYYGIKGNKRAVWSYRRWVTKIWRKWLSRRSQKGDVCWARMNAYLSSHPLPSPKSG